MLLSLYYRRYVVFTLSDQCLLLITPAIPRKCVGEPLSGYGSCDKRTEIEWEDVLIRYSNVPLGLFSFLVSQKSRNTKIIYWCVPKKASWFVYVNSETGAARDQRDDIILSVKVKFLFLATEQFALLGISLHIRGINVNFIYVFIVISRRTLGMRQQRYCVKRNV